MSMADLTLEPLQPSPTLRLEAFPEVGTVDPFDLVASDVQGMTETIKDLLGVDHPVLGTVARYFFDHDGGKKVRPAMVMLMARALNAHWQAVQAGEAVVPPSLPASPSAADPASTDAPPSDAPAAAPASGLSLEWDMVEASQKRLAEITEMIHTASLLHDDVIDMADTRRGVGSVNSVFGNKLAILAGDFLLARASVCLARLRNVPVVELMSTVIENLVKGEVMQMRATLRNAKASADAFDAYMRKSYYKTGSLMANSCRSAAVLAGLPLPLQDAAYNYGKHVGLAFQIVDDTLDFTGTADSLGKPALNDLTQGLVTAPVLLASEASPDLLVRMQRRFEAPGDVDAAVAAVEQHGGVQAAQEYAVAHAQLALDGVAQLAPSPYRTALASLVVRVLDRSH